MARKIWIGGIVAAAAAAAALVATPARAGTSVFFSISAPLYGAPHYAQPGYGYGYGYAQPGYVYSQPGYTYTPGYVYTEPAYVYTQPTYVVRPHRHRHNGWRDSDRDGVPNRFDHRPRNPYRY